MAGGMSGGSGAVRLNPGSKDERRDRRGSAHMFEFTSVYTMSSGHAAVEILAGGQQGVIDSNPERYKEVRL